MADRNITDQSFSCINVYAQNIGLELSEEFLPGVLSNTELLNNYAKLLENQPLSETDDEPAYEYVP